jgi:hypothetical protein
MKKIFYLLTRAILGILIILIGLKGLSEVGTNKTKVTESVELFVQKILVPYEINLDMNLLFQHPVEILYFQNLAIIYGGFLLIFGFGLSKAFVLTGLLVENIFINQLFFTKQADDFRRISMSLALFGGVLVV